MVQAKKSAQIKAGSSPVAMNKKKSTKAGTRTH